MTSVKSLVHTQAELVLMIKISLVQFCLNISFKFHHHNDPHYYFAKRVH